MTVICCVPKCCIICADTFDRPDSSDITVGQTCTWTPSGSPSIDGLELKIPAGSSVTGPSCDRVRLRLRAAAQGNVCKITIGTGLTAVVATITFGAGATPGLVVLTTDMGSTQANFPRIIYNPSDPPTVTLCVGKVGERGGAEFRDNDPNNDISMQMTADTPATPYGPVKLETVSGTVWFNSLTLSYTKSATRPTCSKCNVRICPICFDADFVPLSSTDCKLQVGSGTWVAVDPYVQTENGAAYLYTATGNPSGSRTMVLTAQWSWLSNPFHDPNHPGHTTDPLPSPVRLYVAFSDVNNCHYVEFTKPTLTKMACVRLVRVVGGTKTVLAAIADVLGWWGGGANPVRATVYVDEITGMIHLSGSDDMYALTAMAESFAGSKAAFGTGNYPDWIDIDSLVQLEEFQMYWYAGPGRTSCTHVLRGCYYASSAITNDDFAELHCGVTAISGTWDWAELPDRWNTTSANAWLQFNVRMDALPAVGFVGVAYLACSPNTTGGGYGLVAGLEFKFGWGMNGASPTDYLLGKVITSWVSPIGATIDWTLYIGGAPSATVRRDYCSGDVMICIGGGMISIKPDMYCGYDEPVFYQGYTPSPTAGRYWGVGTGSLGTGSGASFTVVWISHAFDDAPDDPYDAYPPTAQICTPCAGPQYQGLCAAGVVSPRWIRVVVAGVGNLGGGTDCQKLNGTYVVPVAEPLALPRYVLKLPAANTPTNCAGHAGHQVIVTQSGADILVKIGTQGDGGACNQCLLTFTFSGDASKFCTGMTNEVSNSVSETGGLLCVGGQIDLTNATCTLTSIP